jgi:hypothetical protein
LGFEIVADHFVGPAEVGDAEPEAVGLADEEATERVDVEAGGIFDKGKGDPGVAFEALVLEGTAEGAELIGEGGEVSLGDGGQLFELGGEVGGVGGEGGWTLALGEGSEKEE